MRASLKIRNGIIERTGSLNAILLNDRIIIVNPSEILAHEDEIKISIEANTIITDQAFTKIVSNSNVKIQYEVYGNFSFLTHPILFYDNAIAEIENTFMINQKAKIIEAFALGREGHGEEFKKGKIRAKTKIYSNDGELLVFDVLRVEDSNYKNTIGSSGLITIYKIDGKESDIEKYSVNSIDINEEWLKIVKDDLK
ncbi:urease accessory protein UreH [Acidianus sulfidivorans JP7]|uniref:Urease accessory protein UreH n=1 Tax=Acidianus sulfidivorans JP7 TaxID=619593 RepID=A0A2U9ILH3_9CREN|nr:urease accessory protein UreD [Acidianus sulfidivorans]AWR96863.1 urease accessory protein UreH [Acidianus sulfidivorans JP7]